MSSDTIGEAFRRLLLSLALFTDVYLQPAPDSAIPPYLTYLDNVGTSPGLRGDRGTMMWTRQMSADVWQLPHQEDPSLLRSLRNALDGAQLELTTGKVLKLEVQSVDTIPEPISDEVLHHSVTVECKHDPDAV